MTQSPLLTEELVGKAIAAAWCDGHVVPPTMRLAVAAILPDIIEACAKVASDYGRRTDNPVAHEAASSIFALILDLIPQQSEL